MISPREILKKYSVRPRKRFSQSFLTDDNIARKIVAAANLHEEDRVLEIGAGHGILTRIMAERVREIWAVEIDREMAAILEKELGTRKNVRIINEDILKFDLAAWHGELPKNNCKIVGNIPYGIAADILFHILAQRQTVSRVVVMVQKEMAERLTAGPATKAYGIPSVLLQMHARIEHLFNVPPTCFYPPPRVTSAVVALNFRAAPLVKLQDEEFFTRLVRAAFARRRKTLWNNLRCIPGMNVEEETLRQVIAACGLEERVRAEDLAVETLGILSNELLAAGDGCPASR